MWKCIHFFHLICYSTLASDCYCIRFFHRLFDQCNLNFILLMLYLHVWIWLRTTVTFDINTTQHIQTHIYLHTYIPLSVTQQRCEHGRLLISAYNDFISNGSAVFPFEYNNILRNYTNNISYSINIYLILFNLLNILQFNLVCFRLFSHVYLIVSHCLHLF